MTHNLGPDWTWCADANSYVHTSSRAAVWQSRPGIWEGYVSDERTSDSDASRRHVWNCSERIGPHTSAEFVALQAAQVIMRSSVNAPRSESSRSGLATDPKEKLLA